MGMITGRRGALLATGMAAAVLLVFAAGSTAIREALGTSPCASSFEGCTAWIRANHSTDYEGHGCEEYADVLDIAAADGGGVIPVGDNRFFIVLFPDDWESLPERKLVVTLNGSGGCAESVYKWWTQLSEGRGYAIASLQYAVEDAAGDHHFDDAGIMYDNLLSLLDELRGACPLCDVPVVLHGFSLGAGRVVEIAMMDRADDGAKAFSAYVIDSGSGFSAYDGDIPPYIEDAPADAYAGGHFWLYCGEQDSAGATCGLMEKLAPLIPLHGGAVDDFYVNPEGGHGILLSGEPGEPGEAMTALFDYIDTLFQPDLTVNGSDTPVAAGTEDVLSVEVKLMGGNSSGADADWWLAAETPSGWYHYVVTGPDSGRWEPGLRVTYQGPLFDLPSREVLSASGLPAGDYTVYFGVDLEVNGLPDLDRAYFDSVIVTID